MTIALCILGGFVGGIVFTTLFAKRIVNATSDELTRIAQRLHRS